MINAALQAWSYNAEIFKAELARSTWLKARVLEHAGKTQKASLAYKVARRLRAEILPSNEIHTKDLTTEDFEALIKFNY